MTGTYNFSDSVTTGPCASGNTRGLFSDVTLYSALRTLAISVGERENNEKGLVIVRQNLFSPKGF